MQTTVQKLPYKDKGTKRSRKKINIQEWGLELKSPEKRDRRERSKGSSTSHR